MVRVMKYCEKDFVDHIRTILSTRDRTVIENPSFARAAVLVPLFKKGEDCHIVFTKRTDTVRYHKGEISFPGGVFDKKDKELKRTALREAFEEIGLKENDVQIIGVLDDIVTITQFIEIAELIDVPISSLLDRDCYSEREIIRATQKEIVYAYQYENHIIWGATARILKQFLDLVSSPRVIEKFR